MLDPSRTYFLIEFFGKEIPHKLPQNCLGSTDFLDQSEIDRVCKLMAAFGEFQVVIGMEESSLYAAADVRKRLGVPGLEKHEVERFRDKVVMKETLQDSGILVPKVYSSDELFQGVLKFPLIAKPRAYCSSIGVIKIRSREELEPLLGQKRAEVQQGYDSRFCEMRKDDLEYEEFIEGDTYHVDGFVFDGELGFSTTSRHINSCLDFIQGAPLGNISVSDFSEQQKWNDFAVRVMEVMRVPNGAFHLEAFLNSKGERVFLEIAIRPPGGMISRTLSEVHSVDLRMAHVQCQLGVRPSLKKKGPLYSGDLMFPMKYIEEGQKSTRFVEAFSRLSESDFPTLRWSKYPSVGDAAEREFAYEYNLGSFVFASMNIEDIERDIRLAMKTYQVEVK